MLLSGNTSHSTFESLVDWSSLFMPLYHDPPLLNRRWFPGFPPFSVVNLSFYGAVSMAEMNVDGRCLTW